MKDVFIKYNPYKLETEITVDGAPLAENSRLQELIREARLQDWVEDLPDILLEDYNDRDFNVLFHGTRPDYEDLKEVFDEAQEEGTLTAKLEHKPAKETADKEGKIKEVFARIRSKDCPFADLREDPQIQDAFEKALSEDFEVCVVATMSAGKSTLINAIWARSSCRRSRRPAPRLSPGSWTRSGRASGRRSTIRTDSAGKQSRA